MILLITCNYFSLPSPPNPSSEGNEIFPDEPSKVLTNFKNSLELLYDKTVYLNCFSSNFIFQPDKGLPYPLNQPWGKDEEDKIISNLLYSLDFSISNPSKVSYTVNYSSIFSDSAYMNVSFEFRFIFKNIGEKFAKSQADIHFFRQGDGRWVIIYWQDNKLDTLSFGELKFEFK